MNHLIYYHGENKYELRHSLLQNNFRLTTIKLHLIDKLFLRYYLKIYVVNSQ